MAIKTRNVKYYEATRELTDNDKVLPQAKLIIKVLLKKNRPMTRQEVIDGMVAAGLETVQPPARIFSFYRTPLIEQKLVKETIEEEEYEVVGKTKEPKEPKEPKAAKEKKAQSVKGKKGTKKPS